jgi:hypothetical protein
MSDQPSPLATTTTYVAFQHPGALFSEESVVKVMTRNPERDAVKAEGSVFAFFYFDIVTTVVDVAGERIETASGRRNISKTYYIDAELLTSDQVAALPGDNRILLRNMRYNGWDSIVRCRTGNFQPFEQDRQEMVSTR